jgi:hypothetical protein
LLTRAADKTSSMSSELNYADVILQIQDNIIINPTDNTRTEICIQSFSANVKQLLGLLDTGVAGTFIKSDSLKNHESFESGESEGKRLLFSIALEKILSLISRYQIIVVVVTSQSALIQRIGKQKAQYCPQSLFIKQLGIMFEFER